MALGGGSDYGEAGFDSFPANTPGAAEWAPPSWDEVVRTHSARVYRLA